LTSASAFAAEAAASAEGGLRQVEQYNFSIHVLAMLQWLRLSHGICPELRLQRTTGTYLVVGPAAFVTGTVAVISSAHRFQSRAVRRLGRVRFPSLTELFGHRQEKALRFSERL